MQTILDLRRLDRPCKNRKDTKLLVQLKSVVLYIRKVSPSALQSHDSLHGLFKSWGCHHSILQSLSLPVLRHGICVVAGWCGPSFLHQCIRLHSEQTLEWLMRATRQGCLLSMLHDALNTLPPVLTNSLCTGPGDGGARGGLAAGCEGPSQGL